MIEDFDNFFKLDEGRILTSLEGIENLRNLQELYCPNNPQFSVEYKDYLRKYCKEKEIRIFT